MGAGVCVCALVWEKLFRYGGGDSGREVPGYVKSALGYSGPSLLPFFLREL